MNRVCFPHFYTKLILFFFFEQLQYYFSCDQNCDVTESSISVRSFFLADAFIRHIHCHSVEKHKQVKIEYFTAHRIQIMFKVLGQIFNGSKKN